MEGAGDARIHAHGMREKTKWEGVHHDACGGSDRDHAAWDTVMDRPHRHLTARRKRGGRSVDWPPEGYGGPEHQKPL